MNEELDRAFRIRSDCRGYLSLPVEHRVLAAGERIVETQRPMKTGMKIGECLVQADLPIVEYRTKRSGKHSNKSTKHK